MKSPIEVCWQDRGLAVVNKPHGVMVHHPDGGEDLLGLLREQQHWSTVHACHRLDTAAAGALLVAHQTAIAGPATALFAHRAVHKVYLAVCTGVPPWEQRTIDVALEQRGRTARAAENDDDDARPAVTDAKLVGRGRDAALLLCRTRTGRFHQVRAHLAAVGHPLVGDRHYGARHDACLALHALRLAFIHPATGTSVDVVAQVHPVLRRVAQRHGVLDAWMEQAVDVARQWPSAEVT